MPLWPERKDIEGAVVRLAPLSLAQHGEALWEGTGGIDHEELWRYMPDGPFANRGQFDAHLEAKAVADDRVYYAIVDQASGRALGHAALMRIEPQHGVIEVGNILYSNALQRTRGASEAMYLLARYVFEELGYRRYEWKCNSLNEPSRKAALRLGFSFEGIFRQHMIVKGRNRDTAWFSMLDLEWPQRQAEFERWLSPSNFKADGHQITPLAWPRAGS